MEMKIPQNSGMELNRGKKREVGFNGGNGEMGVVFFLAGSGCVKWKRKDLDWKLGKGRFGFGVINTKIVE